MFGHLGLFSPRTQSEVRNDIVRALIALVSNHADDVDAYVDDDEYDDEMLMVLMMMSMTMRCSR